MSADIWRRLVEAGALTSAGTVAATIFCCLPFATGVIGAGMAATGARLASYSVPLSIVSIGLLGYAFHQVYRPGAAACADGSCDSPVTLTRRRVALWILTGVVALLLTASRWAHWIIYWTL